MHDDDEVTKAPNWVVWIIAAAFIANLILTVLDFTRPVVPVSSLTAAIADQAGDVRILLLERQQVQERVKAMAAEIERLDAELKKVKGVKP